MTPSLVAACLWVLVATAIALGPQRFHWPGAAALIFTGIPLAGWMTYENGPLAGVLGLAAGASVLRWPLFRLAQWLRERGRRPD